MSDEWITLQEAANLLEVDVNTQLAQEINLSSRAVVVDLHNKLVTPDALRVHAEAGRIPVCMIPGSDYFFTQTLTAAGGSSGRNGSGNVVHPISHVWKPAILPWAAKRAVDLIQVDLHKQRASISVGPTCIACGCPLIYNGKCTNCGTRVP